MAKGIYTSDITQSSGSLGYTGSPIEDKSAATKGAATAGLVSMVGGEALAAHKGIQTGKATAEDERAVDEFFDARGEAEFFQEAAAEGLVAADDPLVRNAQQDALKLARASESGAISTSELMLHLETRKRERIQQFPGYAQEFRKVYGDVLSDNKVRLGLVESQEKQAATAQSQMEMFIRKDAHNLGIPTAWNAPLDELIQQTTAVNGSKTYHTLYMNDRAKAKEAGAEGYQRSELGRVTDFKTNVTNFIAESIQRTGKEPSPEEVMQFGMGLADSYIVKAKSQFGNTVSDSMYENTRKVLESHITDINMVQSGKMSLDQLNNRNAQIEAIYKNQFLSKPTIGRAVTMFKELPPEISREVAGVIMKDPMGTDLFTDLSSTILHGGSVPPEMPLGDPSYGKALKALTTQNVGLLNGDWDSYDPQMQNDLVKMVTAQSAILGDTRPEYGTEEADSLLDLGSSNAYYETTMKSPEFNGSRMAMQHSVGRFVGDMNDQLMTALQGELDVPTALINPDRGVLDRNYELREIIAVGFDDQGQMSFSVNHAVLDQVKDAKAVADVQAKVSMLNKNFAGRYNKATKAWAHASGHQDYAKASQELIDRHNLYQLPDPQFQKPENGVRSGIKSVVEGLGTPQERMAKLDDMGMKPQTYEEIFSVFDAQDTPKNRLILDQMNNGAGPDFLLEQWGDDPEALDFLNIFIGE
jgi:hypothetical protein